MIRDELIRALHILNDNFPVNDGGISWDDTDIEYAADLIINEMNASDASQNTNVTL